MRLLKAFFTFWSPSQRPDRYAATLLAATRLDLVDAEMALAEARARVESLRGMVAALERVAGVDGWRPAGDNPTITPGTTHPLNIHALTPTPAYETPKS